MTEYGCVDCRLVEYNLCALWLPGLRTEEYILAQNESEILVIKGSSDSKVKNIHSL